LCVDTGLQVRLEIFATSDGFIIRHMRNMAGLFFALFLSSFLIFCFSSYDLRLFATNGRAADRDADLKARRSTF
jgi:hypothetical protein